MANFYTDNEALKHYLSHPMMEKIVALKERDFADADKFDYAPQDYAEIGRASCRGGVWI